MGSNPISRSILTFLFLPIFLFSFEIKESYFLDSEKIYSNDIFPTDDKFLVLTFNNRSTKQLSKVKLLKLLNENYLEAHSKHNVIFFYKISPMLIDDIKLSVRELYEKNQNINITDVAIKPQSMGKISTLTLINVEIRESSLTRAKGVGKAHFGIDGKVVESINFSYRIEGTQKVLVAKRKIDRGSEITSSNTEYQEFPIKQRILSSVNSDSTGLEARVTIGKNQVIDERRVKKAYAIKRGDRVEAKIIDDGIILRFYLKAKSNGYIGDSIELENNSKKIFFGEIIEKRKVEIK